MRIERIDDKTVKCYLSNEEMAEYEITYKDFVTRSPKAKEVVEQIVAQAIEEVGYKPPEFAMDMQIMLMPDQGMILTLSEKTPDEIKNNPTLMEYLRELKRVFEEKMSGEGMTPDNIEKMLTSGVAKDKIPQKAADGAKKPEATGNEYPDFAIFAFSSLRNIYDYVKVLPKTLRVNSSLYVEKGIYYLHMEKGGASQKRYSRACIQAMEYGSLYGATQDKVSYLQEHAECLIQEKAIQKMRV